MVKVALLLLPVAAAGPESGSAAARPLPISGSEYAARRARVLEAMREAGAGSPALLLLRAPRPDQFAADVDYPYRPDNDLLYLSGIPEDGCALLLSSREVDDVGRALLFLAPPRSSARQWTGERLGPKRASEISGLPLRAVVGMDRLEEKLRRLLGLRSTRFHRPPRLDTRRLYLATGSGFAPGSSPTEPYAFLLKTLGSAAFQLELEPPGHLIHRLRQVKSAAEIAILRRAIDVTCHAQKRAMRHARPGVHEYELRAAIEATFLRGGCSGWGFPPIIGSGPNSCIPHYQKYDRRLEAGDLVVVDIGAEYSFYSADVTRTIPASGRFSPRQREIYQVVLEAQKKAIAAVRPGVSHSTVTATARRAVATGLLRLGVIENEGQLSRYFLHRVSHSIGLAVHDPTPASLLTPGMVITVEPGVYIAAEEIGIRIEDDILVTESGAELLSGGAPKEIDEIEKWMAGRHF